ncbi:hypothetical protein OPV22_002767 [Ensete ventricosum]|uniref:Uncharacterized protein n=1 Tax=Ensete ventricosum TaxID=4639 RepID=A0AAV8RYZ8_ENSVE|nr:hypothetical protein OPV22_002767 [Ensete ventricosum]RWV79429.1 hypothetical protein GW17_00059442 [Ensete ventricosum]RZS11566.1 hypothetical protein BHM03_00042904 [Ensete ventricosum]
MEMEPIMRESRRGHGLWTCFCLGTPRVTAEEAVEELTRGMVISREEGDGVVRLKIVMSKQELKVMVASLSRERTDAIGGRGRTSLPPPSPSLEQLLHALRRRHIKRAESGKGRNGGWMPALRSIPEEN